MSSCRHLLITGLVAAPQLAAGADPFYAFEGKNSDWISNEGQAWHDQYEDDGDYGESWFFLGKTDDGGSYFVLLSITNLGMSTYGGVVDINYYSPKGEEYLYHYEIDREDQKVSAEKMDVKIGKARAWRKGSTYRVKITEDDAQVDLTLACAVPAFQWGGGQVDFYEDRSALWGLGLNCARGASSGTFEAKGKSFSLAGTGYHDHGVATIKMPTFLARWYTLRLWDPKLTVILHQQYMSDTFGSKLNRFALVGTADKLIAGARRFTYKPLAWREDDDSGNKIPTELALALKAGGYTITGTVKESRFIDSVDVLGQISWPIRTMIKAFYSDPYLIRYFVQYELDVTDKDGTEEHLSGVGIAEANYY